MLFVFQVETGRMMTFDMSFTMETIQTLKSHVELAVRIPTDKQVLLMSGGEYLRGEDRVCSYSTGTDTNPIFLFSKTVVQSYVTPPTNADVAFEPELAMKVRDSAELPATYQTVLKRMQLAKAFCEASQAQQKTCQTLVHEQHLQQQGWAAVVANLEDLSADLRVRWNLYQEAFDSYITNRDSHLLFLTHFKDDLLILQKIPVLPALIETQNLIVPEAANKQDDSVKEGMNLLEWISQKDGFMDSLFEICSKGLSQTDEAEFEALHKDVQMVLLETDNDHMKEVKGLGDRLCGLETLMVDMGKNVAEQIRLAEAFQRNQTRAHQLNDASVLPDICATHQQQLKVMLENYTRIHSITQRIVMAKYELCKNLYGRLRWIVFMQDTLSELDNKLVFHFQNLLTLQRQLEILQQVHNAPAIYLSSIIEVVRRKKVSQAYMLWSSETYSHLLTFYNMEVAQRKEFQSLIEGHFLSSLFPGMEDLPPTYATQAPSIFDSNLPQLTEDDVERLKLDLPPGMADSLHIPDTSSVTSYFTIKDAKDESDKNDNKTVEDKLMEVVSEIGLASNLDQNILKAIESEPVQTTPHGLPHLRDLDRGCESETDTEEFEKVGQSPFDLHFDKGIPSPRPGTQDAATLTSEDNLQISRSEHERLKSALTQMAQIGGEKFTQLRSDLAETRRLLLAQKSSANLGLSRLQKIFHDFLVESRRTSREVVQRLTVDHELEIIDFRKISQSKNEEIKALKDTNTNHSKHIAELSVENGELKQKMAQGDEDHAKEMDEMRKRMEEVQVEKERIIKETTERLKGEHKSELESIRARFKLMTMERSPSENSLEKIERADYASITNHEALLLQMTENFESEKEVAVSDAVSKESAKWQGILDEKVKQMKGEIQDERAFLVRTIHDQIQQEQESYVTDLREQITNMSLECAKYKDTIQQLTEFSKDSDDRVELVRKIEALERENSDLVREFEKSRSQTDSRMATSVAVYEGPGTSDAATSPVKIRKRSEVSSSASSARVGKVNIDSCKAGDLVLVVWDLTHQIEALERENSDLVREFEKSRSQTDSGMATSVAVYEGPGTSDAATSPVKIRKRSEVSSSTSSARVGKVNIDSCKAGDLVLVVWDLAHQNFKILQESNSLYFLNADCMEALSLKIVDGQPNRLYCYAEVVEKEYCHARKPVNRFRVPQGTKFFRVKVRPLPTKEVAPAATPAPSSLHMSQSQTTTSSQVSDLATTSSAPTHSSLPSSPSRSHWEKSESQEAPIPEEKGEDSATTSEKDEEVEKGTELTENFNVDNQSSIDR